ncbi:MAG: restriction endonuclease-like protein [Muribaculaceae bacterium]|nr:restriction endonuclease-like protein [Muribaculaceae bacterium]
MEVLSFISADGNIKITASTAADMSANWVRFRSRVKDAALTYCYYESSLPGSLLLLPPMGEHLQDAGIPEMTRWDYLPPVFYETAKYNVSIAFSNVTDAPVILHKSKAVTELFNAIQIGDNSWLLTATLSFVNEPGIFELAYRYTPTGNAPRTERLTFRIVSPKLDAKNDYNHILTEVNAQYHEIVFRYLTLTLQNLQYKGHSNSDVVWMAIFRQVAAGYIKAVTYIVNRPHLSHTTEVRYSRADRIKRWTPMMAERYAAVEANGRLDREYFRHEEATDTHNTRENRFIKFTLDRIGRQLAGIIAKIKDRNDKAKAEDKVSDSELAELDSYAVSLRKLANSSLLRGLCGEPLHSESIVLQKRTGYTQVYSSWLLLRRSIEFFDGASAIGVRPIWELYELWCFLKMRQMVGRILGLDFNNPQEITESPMPMVKPFEDNKDEHTVFYNCNDGLKVRLHYQHTYSRRSGQAHTATTENRPDIVLTIAHPEEFELTYLFDAKYRIQDDSRLNNDPDTAQGADYPHPDTLNQMHRYRDAIYFGPDKDHHSAKEVIGAYILFPGRGDNDFIRTRYFYKSIETINIGAFPLLPDARDPRNEGTLLYEFLTKILTTADVYSHIENAIPQKGLRYVK